MKTLIFLALVAIASTANASETCSSDINAHDVYGNTALMVAAADGDFAQVQSLLEKGAHVDARGRIGNTALIYAAQEGHVDIVKILVDAGANIAAQNDYRVTAGSLAKGYGHRDIAAALDMVTMQADHSTQKTNHI